MSFIQWVGKKRMNKFHFDALRMKKELICYGLCNHDIKKRNKKEQKCAININFWSHVFELALERFFKKN